MYPLCVLGYACSSLKKNVLILSRNMGGSGDIVQHSGLPGKRRVVSLIPSTKKNPAGIGCVVHKGGLFLQTLSGAFMKTDWGHFQPSEEYSDAHL